MNPRIESGTRAMPALRAAALAAAETPLGWKVGLGSPAAFERLGTDRPLAGFLLRSGVVIDGAVVRSVTDLLAGRVSLGDVIITGFVLAPVPAGPGRSVAELPPLGALRVELAA